MKKLVYIILCLVAIILIGCGYFYKNSMIEGVCVSVGASILATILINSFQEKWLGDPLNTILQNMKLIGKELSNSVALFSMSKRSGLIGVWSKRANLQTNDWIDYLKQSDNDIKILCYAMSFLPENPNFSRVINEKISKGVKIRILFGAPNGKYIKERTKEERTEGSISERIKTSVLRVQAINDNVEIRYFDAPLYASIYEFGSKMLVTPQLYGIRGASAPLILLEKVEDGLFDAYDKYFENVWAIAKVKNQGG